MLLDLSQFRAPLAQVERTFQPDAFPPDEDMRVVAPVSLAFSVAKDHVVFTLTGTATGVLELVCGRCLEPFTWPVAARFELRYQPQPPAAAGEVTPDLEVAEDDLATAFYEHDQIDLGQLVREQFYLSLPMKPLCQDGCRGLCPECGVNLNRTSCACTHRWDDPRLAVLKTLKSES
ncbi:MAG: DUF177 domain-containing protein [Acidobacteriota bacterium]